MIRRISLTSFFLIFFLGLPALAEVKIPRIFGSNMVLQQEKPIVVWGWDAPGTQVTVTFADKSAQATANAKGEWKVTLPAMKADGKTHVLTIAGSSTITLANILLGEVWLGSGQSNMEMGIKACNDPDAEVAAANWPNIRLFMIPKKFLPSPTNDVDAVWKVCSPITIAEGGWAGFSAAAYYFGRILHTNLNVPVGLIESAWGGTRIEPWTAPEGFAMVPSLASILTQAQAMNPKAPLRKELLEKYLKQTEDWIAASRRSITEETFSAPVPAFPAELLPPQNQQQPSVLYNAMLYGIIPFAMRGGLWYQGEANVSDGKVYTEKLKALFGGWRKLWNSEEMPFYFVQIAPYHYGAQVPTLLPEMWEAMYQATRVINNTGMVVIHDVGDLKDIHPRNKQDVGKRLALQALANTYGGKGVVFSGPVYKSMAVEGETLRLTFDHAGSGLVSRDGKALSHFELIDASEGGWVPASAAVQGSAVVLTSPEVKKPLAVRFAWHKLAEPNLMNQEGLPAVPFRAGDISSRDALSVNVGEVRDYQLVYELDLNKLATPLVYDRDLRNKITQPFDRIAYYVELKDAAGALQWIYVSMDAFTADLSMIGIPTVESKGRFQQNLNNLNIFSGVPGIVTGTGLKGNIEFWPHNYAAANAKNIPNASATALDFGDQMNDPEAGYGSMQIHNYEARQVLFALNNFRSAANADLGIGNRPGEVNTDWTFSGSAKNYPSKRLKVLVRLKK